MISNIDLADFYLILMLGRSRAEDLATEFNLTNKTMIMPNYRKN